MPFKLRRSRPSTFVAIILLLAAVACPTAAHAAPAPPMTVALHQSSNSPLSYFQLLARPGKRVSAGTLELRNRGRRPVRVRLDPLDAVTATTFGSAYKPAGFSLHGPARWIRLSSRRVVLPPHGSRKLNVSVVPRRHAAAGDYLSGIGVQALGRPHQTKVREKVAISSIQRYAIGVEVRLPGPRHPL